MQKILVTIAILLAGAQAATAQLMPLSSVRTGDTVRVWAVAPLLNGESGTFDSVERDTLRFMELGRVPIGPTKVGYPALRRIDVQRGLHRSPTRIVIGSLLGAAAGTLAGAYLGVAIECGSTCGDQGDLEGLGGFLIGGTVGLLAGGVTGGIIAGRHRSPRWNAVDLRR